LNKELGITAELIRSRGGVFEVEYGGKVLFSKKKSGRFPDEGEVVQLLRKGT
jgi:selenoprotein W-related protein